MNPISNKLWVEIAYRAGLYVRSRDEADLTGVLSIIQPLASREIDPLPGDLTYSELIYELIESAASQNIDLCFLALSNLKEKLNE